MASEVSICNLALSNLGADATIASLTEQSQEAFFCNRLYSGARDYVLRAFPWGFARHYLALSDLGTPVGGWAYRYGYPAQCLTALEIVAAGTRPGPKAIEFEIALADDFSSQVILTDQEAATLIYTRQVTVPSVFSSMFIQALSWKLSTELAMPITRDAARMEAAQKMYSALVSEARARDANEGFKELSKESEWITARA